MAESRGASRKFGTLLISATVKASIFEFCTQLVFWASLGPKLSGVWARLAYKTYVTRYLFIQPLNAATTYF